LNTVTLIRRTCEYQRTRIILWTLWNAITCSYSSDKISY